MAVTKAQVAQLYVALFNRAPEGAGLNAWTAAGATQTLAQVADQMLAAPAVQAYFNGRIDSNVGYVENIYKNILGKDLTTDSAGINAWASELDRGVTRGEVLDRLFKTATSADAIAADPTAAAVFANKTAIAAYMAEKVPNISQDGNGNYAYEQFKNIIETTNSTNLAAQKAKVDQIASGQTPSANKNLTAETDNIVGTDGDDTFSGVYYVGNGAKTSTLSSLDTLDGKAGKDTLNLTVQKNGGDSNSVEMSAIEAAMRGVSNIENLNIRSEVKFQGNADINKGLDNLNIQTIGDVVTTTDTKEKVTIDTTGVVNLTANDATKEITAKSSSAEVTVNASKVVDKVNIEAGKHVELNAAEVKDISVKAGSAAGSNTKVIAPKATKASINLTNNNKILDHTSSLTAVADLTLANLTLDDSLVVAKAAKISLKDVKFGTSDNKNISTDAENVELSMTYTGDNIGKVNLTASATNKVKTLSINAKAQKSATLTIDSTNINSLTKVTVAGDAKDLTLDLSAQTALKDIDASAFTGNFAKFAINNVENSTVKLGSGDDVVSLTLNPTPSNQKKQTIDGGAGTDLLMIDAAIAAGGKSDDVTLNNFEGLKISGQIGTTAIDMAKWTGFSHITLVGDSSASVTSNNATFNNLLNNSTITLEGKKADHNITLNIKDAATGTNDTVNIVLDPKTYTVSGSDKIGLNNGGNFVIDDIENVNITSNLDTEKTEGVKNTVKFDATADTKGVLTNTTIKGNADTEVIFGTNIKKIKTLDASALTGKFKFDGTAHVTENATIKGSATKDNDITLNATAKGSTVTTGAGKDTITLVSTEKYTVNAGENDDTIKGIGSKSGSVVTGGAGNDTFNISKLGDTAAFPASKVATIKDFSAGDKLHLGANVGTLPTNIVKYEASGSLDFANNLSRALDAAGGQDKLAYFTYTDPDSNSTDTYLVRADNTAGISAGDYVVKLAGTVNLDNARISNVDTDGNSSDDTLQITL